MFRLNKTLIILNKLYVLKLNLISNLTTLTLCINVNIKCTEACAYI